MKNTTRHISHPLARSAQGLRSQPRLTAILACVLAVLGTCLLPAGVSAAEWKKDTTVNDVAFERVKVGDDGKVIGFLAAATKVRGRPCAKDWLHLHANGELALFKLEKELELAGFTAPAGTWVFQNDSGAVTACAFPSDIELEGQPCRGTGGPKGVQVSFHANGHIKRFFPSRQTRIDGILCDTGSVRGIVELYENGRLKSCLLAEDLKQDGASFSKGERVVLDENGRASAE